MGPRAGREVRRIGRGVGGLVLAALAAGAGPAAAAEFRLGGRVVPAESRNFAGERHATPRFGIAVQINHDARPTGPLELTAVDDALQALIDHHRRGPLVRASLLPIVVVSEAKFRRFAGDPHRKGLGAVEEELRRLEAAYVSPVAIFIPDAAVGDPARFARALAEGLRFLFHEEFSEVVRRTNPYATP